MQNVKEWTDRYGSLLEVGQRIVAVRGRTLMVGVISHFTPQGVTIDAEDTEGATAKENIGNYNGQKKMYDIFLVDNLIR